MQSQNKKKTKEAISNSNLLFIIATIIFIVMYGFAILRFPGSFLQFQTFFDLFSLNAPLIILTLGMSIVMIGGGIDISVGAVTGLVTMGCAVLLESKTGTVGSAMLLALAIGLGFGLLQGFIIAYLEIQPFIITLAGMFLANGLLTTIHKDPINVTYEPFVALRDYNIVIPFLGNHNRLGNFMPLQIKIGAVVVFVLIVILVIMMNWSRLGRNLYAVGGNSQSALMLGINVKKTKFISYLISGLLSGIAGFVYLMTTGAGNVGNAAGFEMKAIAASIIGGTMLTGGVGNLLGSPVGALTLLTINELIRAAGVNSNYQAILSGFLLYIFIVMQSAVVWLRSSGKFKLAILRH
ncbi:ABC transporter permease subunit [Gracilinema caldarium]|uniref:ABC-type transporter, integral membrane subunit n=1 Tax=Gracilinema caldarium (strain ATCC 51460 / DSM 7334 / H1) TaxID=744872 RepID=F8F3A1_GRAC1|nr:ABC transporter permease [Gracilinema caldarium]AEJ20427.1 ABC-type transporter, integral membrane subunit [Gracilinema caldarium DSM 7334]